MSCSNYILRSNSSGYIRTPFSLSFRMWQFFVVVQRVWHQLTSFHSMPR